MTDLRPPNKYTHMKWHWISSPAHPEGEIMQWVGDHGSGLWWGTEDSRDMWPDDMAHFKYIASCEGTKRVEEEMTYEEPDLTLCGIQDGCDSRDRCRAEAICHYTGAALNGRGKSRRAESEVQRLKKVLSHLGDLAERDHNDLQGKIHRLHLLLHAVLDSDMAQQAEDEGRVVPELEAVRRFLGEASND